MDYKQKYLKYKLKYLNLKKQMGGDIWVGKYNDNSTFEGKYYKDSNESNLKTEGLPVPEEKFGWTKCENVDFKEGFYYANKQIIYNKNNNYIWENTVVLFKNTSKPGVINVFTFSGWEINANKLIDINDFTKIDDNSLRDILNKFFILIINKKIKYKDADIKNISVFFQNKLNNLSVTFYKQSDSTKQTIVLTDDEIQNFKPVENDS